MVITKYANRRLYADGKHLTLRQVAQMVRDGRPVVVTCARTRNDITKDVLAAAAALVLPSLSVDQLLSFVRQGGLPADEVLPLYWLCEPCREARGWALPPDLVCTVVLGRCGHCLAPEDRTLIPERDFRK